MDLVRLKDMLVPEVWALYQQQYLLEKSRIIKSGIVGFDSGISAKLAMGGLTFHVPSYQDLDPEDEENLSMDVGANSGVSGIGSSQEIQVRLSRNKSFGSADLVSALTGSDPLDAIQRLVGTYWERRLQRTAIAVMTGVFNNSALPDDAYHKKDDLIHDISGTAFKAGETDITSSAFIDATVKMGDEMGALTNVCMHSIVYSSLQKKNLIVTIPDARGEITIPTYLGRKVIVDDSMPNDGKGLFDTYLAGDNVVGFGSGSAKVPVAISRNELANQGGGEEILTTRVEWCLHPRGYAYKGATPASGPANNVLNQAASWERAWQDRKSIRLVKLTTREY
ncbi:hypothetical protein [Vibrio phage vB_VibM_83AMN]|nr:hypothetical protein [Vibrio phage vB_VibM_83AMN]